MEKAYSFSCVGCDSAVTQNTEMIAFAGRVPNLVYCPQCFRAYDTETHQPLRGEHSAAIVYFDKEYTAWEGEEQRRCRIVEMFPGVPFAPTPGGS